jgi:hypothetical protein
MLVIHCLMHKQCFRILYRTYPNLNNNPVKNIIYSFYLMDRTKIFLN